MVPKVTKAFFLLMIRILTLLLIPRPIWIEVNLTLVRLRNSRYVTVYTSAPCYYYYKVFYDLFRLKT